MKSSARVGQRAALVFLPLALLLFGSFGGLYSILGSPQAIKETLHQSGVYNLTLADVVPKASEGEGAGNTEQASDIPANQAAVQQALQNAFPPAELQTQVGSVLDSTYDWLNGRSQTLNFKLDLTDARQKFADSLAQYVQSRLATLPFCPANTPIDPNLDPFTATCKPTGTDEAALAAKTKQTVLDSKFLQNAQFSPTDLHDSKAQEVNSRLQALPRGYRLLKWGTYLSAALAMVCAATAIMLADPRRRGVRKVAVVCIVVGALSIATAWLTSFGVDLLLQRVHSVATNPLQDKLIKAGSLLLGRLEAWWLWFGIVLATVGAGSLIGLWILGRRAGHSAATTAAPSPEPPEETETPTNKKNPAL